MKAMSHLVRCSFALGSLVLAAVLTLGGTFAYADAIDTPTAVEATATVGNANLAERPDALFCITYGGGDQTCIVEAQLEALYGREADEADHAASWIIEEAPSATDALTPALYFVDAIKVEITQTVTIAAPGQDVESDEPAYTGSVPTELKDAPETETPGLDGAN